MSVYKKGKKTGRWRVVVRHKGVQREKIVQGSKKEAEAFEARWRLELESRDPVEYRTAPTFSDFCVTHYRAYAEHHLGARTWRNRQYQLATLIDYFGAIKMNAISTGDIDQYKQARIAQGIRATTINDELKVLRAVFSLALELGVPAQQPKFRRLPEPGKGRVLVWTEDEVQRLYDACARVSPAILPIVVFLVNTGARKGEALALRWASVDLTKGFIEIHPYEGWQPKNGKPREVPISSGLRPWLEQAERVGQFVFTTSKGTRYAFWPQRKFDRARAAAGLTGGPHTTRHTFASHFLAGQPDLFLLAELLGHSHQRVTELYAHLLPDHLERARDAVSIGPRVSVSEWRSQLAEEKTLPSAADGSRKKHGCDHGRN